MKTNPVTFAILLAIAAGNLPFNASAADTQSGLKAGDEKFVKQAGAAGMAEVKIATLGTQKAERSDVKDLATQLVTDHTKANAELEALAKSKGVELSAVIDPKSASTFESLEKESGKSFDKAFLAHLEKAHKTCVADFEDASKNAADADVKAWAGKMLPTLRAHLDKVKELEAK
jgi:putative membrane protein